MTLNARRLPYAAATAILWLLLVSPPASRAEIRYAVSLAHPEQHLFHVSIEIPDVKAGTSRPDSRNRKRSQRRKEPSQ